MERLQKIISQAGVASRRQAEVLIQEGKVTVNGKVVTELGLKADPLADKIKVNGKPLQAEAKPVYFLLNKHKWGSHCSLMFLYNHLFQCLKWLLGLNKLCLL